MYCPMEVCRPAKPAAHRSFEEGVAKLDLVEFRHGQSANQIRLLRIAVGAGGDGRLNIGRGLHLGLRRDIGFQLR